MIYTNNFEVKLDIIEWKDSYNVNIEIIDEHHKMLVELLNLLQNVSSNYDDKTTVFYVIDNLKNYTKFHFTTEENLMKKYNYFDYENHIIEHSSFVEKIEYFEEKLNENNNLFSIIELINYLRWWLLNHIVISDKIMAQHLIKLL